MKLATPAERFRVIFAGICALILSVGLARFAYTPMLPIMREHAGLSDLAGGWLATINYAGYMSGALLGASISNLDWKFKLYRFGLVAAVLSTAAMGLTENIWCWAGLRFVAGFSSTAGLLLGSGLVLNWLIRHGHRAELGLHFMGLGLGVTVSGVAVAAMAGWLSWDHQWLGLGILGLLFFWPAWCWLPAPVATQTTAAHTTPAPIAPTKRWMWLLIAAYFCAGVGYVVSATFIVAILVKLPVFSGKGNGVWIMVGVAAIPSCFVWDRIASAIGQIRALMVAFALEVIAIALPAFTAGAWPNIVGGALFGATFVGIVSLTLTLTGRHFPANPAKAMARMTLSYGVAQIFAPALAGYIATTTGSFHGALLAAAAMMAVGIVLLQLLLQEENQRGRRTNLTLPL